MSTSSYDMHFRIRYRHSPAITYNFEASDFNIVSSVQLTTSRYLLVAVVVRVLVRSKSFGFFQSIRVLVPTFSAIIKSLPNSFKVFRILSNGFKFVQLQFLRIVLFLRILSKFIELFSNSFEFLRFPRILSKSFVFFSF